MAEKDHVLEPRCFSEGLDRDDGRKGLHELHVHTVPDRMIRAALGIVMEIGGVKGRVIRVTFPYDLCKTSNPTWVRATVVKKNLVSHFNGVFKVIPCLVIPYAVPAGHAAGLEVLDREGVGFGLH